MGVRLRKDNGKMNSLNRDPGRTVTDQRVRSKLDAGWWENTS